MRRLIVLLSALFLLASAPAAVAGSALPAVLTQGKPAFQIRPAVIAYTGDGTGLVGGTDGTSVRHPGHLRWTTYNALEGVGKGLLWLNDCKPSCAGGTFTSTPVTAYVFAPKAGHFQILTLTFAYHGKNYTDTRTIRHFRGIAGGPGFWAYDIASTP